MVVLYIIAEFLSSKVFLNHSAAQSHTVVGKTLIVHRASSKFGGLWHGMARVVLNSNTIEKCRWEWMERERSKATFMHGMVQQFLDKMKIKENVRIRISEWRYWICWIYCCVELANSALPSLQLHFQFYCRVGMVRIFVIIKLLIKMNTSIY